MKKQREVRQEREKLSELYLNLILKHFWGGLTGKKHKIEKIGHSNFKHGETGQTLILLSAWRSMTNNTKS